MSDNRQAGQFIPSQDIEQIQQHINGITQILNKTITGVTTLQKAPPPETVPPKFVLGARSRGRLQTLKPELAKVVQQAVTLTTVDFTVLETIRTIEEQKAAVASGHSRTMQSLHLQQADGFAHAVDLGAWVNGTVSWNAGLYADIAYAMDQAATAQGVAEHIRWGGAWDRMLSDFGGNPDAYAKETIAYASRHAGSDLIDLPHFEWHN